MPTEVEQLRDLARAFWAGKEIICPKHPGVKMTGTFVQTTFADHIFLTCPRGKETIAIPHRPQRIPFQAQQVEGLVEDVQRGDANLCYRCQSERGAGTKANATTGLTYFPFPGVRCF